MAEPVGDLVVDLSLDAARFDEQMARVRRHFSGTESDAKKTAAVVEQSLSRQALAAQKAGISVGQYKAAMRMLPAQFTDVATQLAVTSRWPESGVIFPVRKLMRKKQQNSGSR